VRGSGAVPTSAVAAMVRSRSQWHGRRCNAFAGASRVQTLTMVAHGSARC